MAEIEIQGWKDHDVGFTGWDSHAKSELTKRLNRSLNSPQAEIKSIVKRVQSRELIVITGLSGDGVKSVRQMLETMGAELAVTQSDKR